MSDLPDLAASPTGTPLLPPNVARWLLVIYAIASGTLGGLVLGYPNVHGYGVALGILGAIGGGLGLASPGLRAVAGKAAVLVLAGGLVLGSAPGCALFRRVTPGVEAAVATCGARGVDLAARIDAALASKDYAAFLDALLTEVGPEVVCVVQAYRDAQAPAQGGGGPVAAAAEPVTPLQRAERWLLMHPKAAAQR